MCMCSEGTSATSRLTIRTALPHGEGNVIGGSNALNAAAAWAMQSIGNEGWRARARAIQDDPDIFE